MPPKIGWIPVGRIEDFIGYELGIVFTIITALAWIIYKIFLRKVSSKRHEKMHTRFVSLSFYAVFTWLLIFGYTWAKDSLHTSDFILRISAYVALIALVTSAIWFVKICRIFTFEALFLAHMREGVPVLIVNLITAVITILVAGFIANDVFQIRLAPFLATSAVLSVVLGFALQDTLGNLFAGVSLQFDKPYEIGDWIEISTSSSEKWVGQVQEISWRATVMEGFLGDFITVPNRVIAQSKIANYYGGEKPFLRTQLFRFDYGADFVRIEKTLIAAALTTTRVRQEPAPLVLLTETHPAYVVAKLIYTIDDFGAQYVIGNEVVRNALVELAAEGLKPAPERLIIENSST